jgi:hypothetical protein
MRFLSSFVKNCFPLEYFDFYHVKQQKEKLILQFDPQIRESGWI